MSRPPNIACSVDYPALIVGLLYEELGPSIVALLPPGTLTRLATKLVELAERNPTAGAI